MNKERISFLDFSRGIAVILMFITHSYRLQMPHSDTWLPNQLRLDSILNFFMMIEPFTSALFLFLAGYSYSVMQINSDPKIITNIILKKSFLLLILSWIINLLLYSNKGLFLDHLFLSSGILQAIAIALVLNLVCKKTSHLLFAILLVSSIELSLELLNLSILGLNAGAGSIIPVIGYSFIGNFYQKTKNSKYLFGIIPIILGFFFSLNWRYDVEYSIYNIIQEEYQNFSNWNHSLFGFVLNSSLLLFVFQMIDTKNFRINFINLLGKHSLSVYVFHLVVISLFYYNSWGLANPTETLLFIVALLICSNYLLKIKKLIIRR